MEILFELHMQLKLTTLQVDLTLYVKSFFENLQIILFWENSYL